MASRSSSNSGASHTPARSFQRLLGQCSSYLSIRSKSPSGSRPTTAGVTSGSNSNPQTSAATTAKTRYPRGRSIKYIFLSPFKKQSTGVTPTSLGLASITTPSQLTKVLADGIHTTTTIAVAYAIVQPTLYRSDPLDLAIQDLTVAHGKAKQDRWPCMDRITVMLNYVNQYTAVVGIAISSNPTIAGLVWAGVRFLLTVTLNQLEYLDHMEYMLVTVIDKMAICQFFERIYADSKVGAVLQKASSQQTMQEKLSKALGLFYEAIRRCVDKAKEFLQSTVKTMFLPFVQEMQPFLDEIKAREDELRLCADMATMKRVMDMATNLVQLQHMLDEIKVEMVSWSKLDEIGTTITTIYKSIQDNIQDNKQVMGDILYEVRELAKSNAKNALKLSFAIDFNIQVDRRNPDFVGRADLLARLELQIKESRKSAQGSVHIVLYGTGGMGKTQLALEYVYRHSTEYSSIFWVNATSTKTLERDFIIIMERLVEHHAQHFSGQDPDYTRIGQMLGMAGKLDSAGAIILQPGEEKHVINAVRRYFATKGNTKWLLIFDNYDDIKSVDIDQYAPACSHGTVLITTRRVQCIHGRRGFEVSQMSISECETLLLKSAVRAWSEIKDDSLRKSEKAAVATLLEKLGYVPLAVNQAGAYIQNNLYTFSRYLREYEENVTYFLQQNSKIGSRERSVFAAWELSFEAIIKENPRASNLLLICGFLGNDDLCDDLLCRGLGLPEDDMLLRESIQVLFSYSFANRKGGKDDSFSIHPLVHEWARRRLEMKQEDLTQKAIEAFMVVMTAITKPPGTPRVVQDWIFERRVMPHIAAVEEHMKREKNRAPQILGRTPGLLAAVCHLGRIYMQHGRYEVSLEWYMNALTSKKEHFGTQHKDSLSTVHDIGLVHSVHAQYDKALEWFQQALSGRKDVLGPDDPDTLQTVHEMAVVFAKQGKYDLALVEFTRALKGREKVLGEEHLETLMTVNSLALVDQNLGRYNEALEGYRRALAGRENALGEAHPETLTTVNNMALIFSKLGNHELALQLYHRALSGKEASMGKDHQSVLTTVHNIGLLYVQIGKYDVALEWYQRALHGMEKSLGSNNPLTLTTVHDIALVYQKQAQYEKATTLYRRAFAGRVKALGDTHPETLHTINNLGTVFRAQGKLDLALEQYTKALEGKVKSLGSDHLDTLATVHNMATVLCRQKRYDEALEYFQRALVGYEKAMGPEHSSTLKIVSSIATIYNVQEQRDTALEWYTRASNGLEKSLGASHPETLAVLTNIATVHQGLGKNEIALEWYGRALVGLEQALGAEHPFTLTTMYNMGGVFEDQKLWDKALDMYKQVLAGQDKTLGITHPDTLDTTCDIAGVYEKKGDLDSALENFERVFRVRHDTSGDEDPATQQALAGLVQVLEKAGQTSRALELRERLVGRPGSNIEQ